MTNINKTITVFVSEHCTPCKEIDRLIKEGRFEDKIELVDIETDEGFEKFSREVLRRGDGAVPSAYRDGQRCQILVEDDEVFLNCPNSEDPAPEYHPSSEEG